MLQLTNEESSGEKKDDEGGVDESLFPMYLATTRPTTCEDISIPKPEDAIIVASKFEDMCEMLFSTDFSNLNEKEPNFLLVRLIISCHFDEEIKNKYLGKLKDQVRDVDVECIQSLFHNLGMTLTTQIFQERLDVEEEKIVAEKKIKKLLADGIDRKEMEEDYTELGVLNMESSEFESIFQNIDDDEFNVDELNTGTGNDGEDDLEGLPDFT